MAKNTVNTGGQYSQTHRVQHIWQWHGTFEDCQSVRTLGLGSVFDLYCPVLPVLSHGLVCTVIVSLLDILGVVFGEVEAIVYSSEV